MEPLSRLRALPMQHRFLDAEVRRITPETLPPGLAAETVERAKASDQALYEVAISSEFAVPRWFGTETLLHKKSAVDMSYMRRGAAVLVDHGFTGDGDQVGVIESARLDDDKVLRGIVRFSRNNRGQEIERDVVDKIRRFISVGYNWLEARMVGSSETEGEQWEVTRWTPMEVSFVSVPADVSVGVGRSADTRAVPFKLSAADRLPEITMSDDTNERPSRSERRELARQAGDAADITELCQREGHAELAGDFIRAGMTANDVGRRLLGMRDGVQPSDLRPPVRGSDDAPQRDELPRGYSLARGILALADGRSSLETEFSRDLEKRWHITPRQSAGMLVPLAALMYRATPPIDSATTNAAKELVFTAQGEFIDVLRPLSIVGRLGATFLPGLVGPVGFPRQTGAAQAFWVAENPGADVTASNLTTDLVTLAAKTLMGTTSFTRQLLGQTSINVEQLVRNDLTKVHALAIDRASLHGAGSATEPAGIYAISGVNSVAMGGVPTYAKLISMEAEVATDNALLGPAGWATTPALAAKLMTVLVASSAGSEMCWTGTFEDGRVGGYKAVSSNQVSSTLGAGAEHGLIFGNWADLLIGLWGGLEVIVDPYAQKEARHHRSDDLPDGGHRRPSRRVVLQVDGLDDHLMDTGPKRASSPASVWPCGVGIPGSGSRALPPAAQRYAATLDQPRRGASTGLVIG